MAQTWYVIYRQSCRYFWKQGYLYHNVYLDLHDAPAADSMGGAGIDGSLFIGQGRSGYYFIGRTGLLFDTSCLPPGMTIGSADVLLWIGATPGGLVPTLVDGSTLNEPLDLADYGELLPMIISLGSVVVPFPNPTHYVPLPLNAGGLAVINPSGLTKYGLREAWDISKTPPGIGANWTVAIAATAYDGFRIGQVTITDITYTSSKLTGEITEVGSGGRCPVVLKVVGDGSGDFSNIDVRLKYSPSVGIHPYEYLPWHDNQAFYAPWVETVTDLSPGTGYNVIVEYRFHGTSTIYECGGGHFVTPIHIAYSITATSTSGGSITPSGVVPVLSGDDQAFAMAPLPGYFLSDVLVDGVSVGCVSSYNFINVLANHTIHAIFAPDPPNKAYALSRTEIVEPSVLI